MSRITCPQWLSVSVARRRWKKNFRAGAMLLFCGVVAGGFSLLRAQIGRGNAVAQRGEGRLVISPLTRQKAAQNLASLPWAFEPNVGQTDSRVKFLARANDATVFLTQSSVVIAWPTPLPANSRAPQPTLRLEFSGAARNASISGEKELPGKTNYLLGNDPRKWRTNVPHFSAVEYRGLYPGIDAQFYGGPLGLEYDLIAAPHSDLRNVALHAGGATGLRLDTRGNLVARVAGRDVLMRRPEIFQLEGARLVSVKGDYRLIGRDSFGFAVGAHREDLPLVIDPSISVAYTTFLGGNGAEKGNSVAVDSTGAVYVGGTTADFSTFPETPTCNDIKSTTCGGTSASAVSNLFVAKIDTTKSGATSLVYLTFIGGSADDEGGIVAVDNSATPADLAILGWSTSADFPTTLGTKPSGTINLTISKLNGAGSAFVYSEFYGGSGLEATQGTGAIVTNSTGGGIATDSAGDVFVTSDTTSTDLTQPTVRNGFQQFFEGTGTAASGTNNDGFFAKFDTSGSLVYASYFGIAAMVGSSSVAVDASGNAYVAGFTSLPSNTFPPLTTSSFQSTYGGGNDDGIVLEINPNAVLASASLVYASYLGGTGTDQAFAIGVDNASPANAYVTGSTNSTDFVSKTSLTNGFQSTLGSLATSNAFLAVIKQAAVTFAPSLSYASYLGGTKADSGQGVAIVSSSNVLIAGKTNSTDFPVFCQSQNLTGTEDAFIASFNPTATGTASLNISTFLGGSATAEANSIATDASGDAIIFGDTVSSDYPTARDAGTAFGFQPTCTSCGAAPPFSDAFLTKTSVSTAPSGCLAFSPATFNFGSVSVGSASNPFNGTVTNAGNANVSLTGVTVVGANAADFPLQSLGGSECTAATVLGTTSPSNQCTLTANFNPTVAGPESASVQITDTGANTAQQNLDLIGTGTAPEVQLTTSPPSSPPALTFPNTTQGTTSSPQTVTVTNTGNANLSITSVAIDGTVGNPTDWPAPTASGCLSGAIAPGGTCTIDVTFAPNTTGPLTGQLDIVDNANNATSPPANTQTVALSGNGTAPAPIVGLSPMTVAFGTITFGTTPPPQTITVTNSGTATLNFSAAPAVTGPNANQFQIVGAGTTCSTSAGVASGGGTCAIQVQYLATAAGSANAAVALADNASPSTQNVPLTGTANGPQVTLSSNSIAYGNVDVGTTGTQPSVTLTNNGNQNLTITSLTIDPSFGTPSDFTFSTTAGANTCATVGTVVPGGTCTIGVNFTPAATGAVTGQVDISDNATPPAQNISMSGTGTAPGVSLNPTSLSFGNQAVGTTSTSQTVTVTNNGTSNLVFSGLTVTGTNSGDFQIVSTGTTCTTTGSVTPGNTCNIAVDFVPQASGSRTASLSLADNAAGSPQTVALSGTGTQPVVGLSMNTISFGSVNVGSTSTAPAITLTNTGNQTLTISSVTIDPSMGVPGDFAISTSGGTPCSTVGTVAPSGTCTITVSFTPAAQGAVTGQVDINDDASPATQNIALNGTGTAAGVSLVPSTLSFPNTSVGSTSTPQTVVLTNTGNINLVISSLGTTGTGSGDFQILPSPQTTCPVSGTGVPPSGTCNIVVAFAPTTSGSLLANVSIADNAASSPQLVALSGTGTQPGISFNPPSLAYGSVNVGTTAGPSSVTVTNTGNQALTISSVTIDPGIGTPGDFAFSGTNNCVASSPIAPSATCTISVTFTPGTMGAITGQLDVTDNAPGSPQTISLGGTGTSPGVSLLPSSLIFGNVTVGKTSASQTSVLTNNGTATLFISSLSLTGGNAGDFNILSPQTTCPINGAGLAPSASCNIVVDFAPVSSGPLLASVSIADNASSSPQTVALSGTGTQPAVSLTQTSLAFGNVNVGTTFALPSVTLTNTGNQNLTISSVKINPGVGTPGDFALSGSNTCETIGNVAPSATCTITVSFTPAAQGAVTGQVDITDDAPGTPQTIALSGTGTAPGVSLSASSLSFPNENVGSASSPMDVTLTNNGSGPLTINSISFPCPSSGDFCQTDNCPVNPAQLASTTACVISVVFQPTATGKRSATLAIADSASGSPQTVALSGTGTRPNVSLSPSSGLSFPATVVGTTSGTRSLTVSNTGTGPLVVSSVDFKGANATDFSAAGNCTGPGVSIAPGGNCTLNVTFVPQLPDSPATRTATLQLTDNAASSPQSESVSGQATDFSLSPVSGGVTTATITAGDTAVFPLQINPVNGFTGTVSFGCSNPPTKGNCSISPPSISITGPNPVGFSVSVSTTANTKAFLLRPPVSPRPRFPGVPVAMWTLLALALFLFARWRGRKRLRLIPACAFVVALTCLAACSSTSGGGGGGGGGTPPGTYTVTVNGSIPAGAGRPLQLTITVN